MRVAKAHSWFHASMSAHAPLHATPLRRAHGDDNLPDADGMSIWCLFLRFHHVPSLPNHRLNDALHGHVGLILAPFLSSAEPQWLVGLDETLRRLDAVIAAAKKNAGLDPDAPVAIAGYVCVCVCVCVRVCVHADT